MSSVHVDAAKKGEQAIEVDLFHLVDTDHSGHLERQELRHLLAEQLRDHAPEDSR